MTATTTTPTAPRQRAPARELFGWAMFDFANQSYTLLIITVIFGDLFTRVIVGDAPDYRIGNLLWSLALAASYLLAVVCAPVAGAIMDYDASKKRFLFASYVLTVLATAALYFVAPGLAWLGVVLLIVSNLAYSLGESFIASFLPGLGPPEDLGKISGFGWALGYIGGMCSAIFVLLVLGEVSAENFERIRWVGPWAAVFFLLAAIPTFLWVRERARPRPRPPGQGALRLGLGRVAQTLAHLRGHPDLALLLVSVFFSMSGISIIITYAFIYGAQVIGWDGEVRTLMFVLVQITAALGALGFGFVQDRLGALRTYRITLWMWLAAIALIYLTPEIASQAQTRFGLDWEAQHVFLVVGCVAGLSLGACQSSTRTLVGLFAPRSRAAELFGFWGLATKLAGAFGLLAIGLVQGLLGLHSAILLCLLLFAAALFGARGVIEQRGRALAEAHDRGRAPW
ncbi:MFS transporter [Marichromatium gracile]|uniref:MFS transporter n=1 Tax=Marichromatium gracile TaxID=1048 RepID=UPI001F20ECD5|nr:MFS transporter [Marichromatium gracile]MCF1184739.1 MFS transporter [Marichromatium gracile]